MGAYVRHKSSALPFIDKILYRRIVMDQMEQFIKTTIDKHVMLDCKRVFIIDYSKTRAEVMVRNRLDGVFSTPHVKDEIIKKAVVKIKPALKQLIKRLDSYIE